MTSDTSAIRVLLVDDHHAVADALSRILDLEPDFRVVGVAYSVAEARLALRTRVDVVLMDYLLPDGTGAEATRAVKARWPTSRVVMLTAHDDDATVLESIQAGADGFLSKTATMAEVVAAVRAAHAGETLLPATVIAKIAQRVASARDVDVARRSIEPLTPREREILQALSEGLPTTEVCRHLLITPNTLRTHVQNITGKLNVHSKLEAVAFALRYGIIEPPGPASRTF